MLPGGRHMTSAPRARARGRGVFRGTRAGSSDARGGANRQVRFNDAGAPLTNTAPPVRGRGSVRGLRGPSQPTRASRNAAPSTRGTPVTRTTTNAPRTNTLSPGGDAAAYAQRYQLLKKNRDEERIAAIRNGFLADPDKPRTLAEAITPVGTCQDMCAEFERVERVVQNDVWVSEVDPNAVFNGPGTKLMPDEARMVKKFRRAAAGIDEQLPSDLRPPIVLQKTIDYLFNTVIGQAQFLGDVHYFVWDRTRAIRNDFSIQQVTKIQELNISITSYERIARFHILSLHQLALVEKPYDKYDSQQEREQLDKTLLSLMQYYDDSRGRVQSPNEAEFRAYCIIFQIQHPVSNLEDRMQTWPQHLLVDGRVQRALKLYKAASNTNDPHGPFRPRVPQAVAHANWRRFWMLIQSNEISYLMACVAEIYFGLVRRTALNSIWQAYRKSMKLKNEDWSLSELIEVLGLEDETAVQHFCEDYGFTIAETDEGVAVLDLNSVNGTVLPDPSSGATKQRKSELVEQKRHYRTLPAVINGMSVRAAREAGFIEQPPAEDAMEQDEEDKESLFLPSDDKPRAATQSFSTPNPFATKQSSFNPAASPFAPVAPAATSNMPPILDAKPSPFAPALGFGNLGGTSTASGSQSASQSGSTSSPFALSRAAPAPATAPSPFSNPSQGSTTNKPAPSFGAPSFSEFPPSVLNSSTSTATTTPLGSVPATSITQSPVYNFGDSFKPSANEQNTTNAFSSFTPKTTTTSIQTAPIEAWTSGVDPQNTIEHARNLATAAPPAASPFASKPFQFNPLPGPTSNLFPSTTFNPPIDTDANAVNSTSSLSKPPPFTFGPNVATPPATTGGLPVVPTGAGQLGLPTFTPSFPVQAQDTTPSMSGVSASEQPAVAPSPFAFPKTDTSSIQQHLPPLSPFIPPQQTASTIQQLSSLPTPQTSTSERKARDDKIILELARRMVLEPRGFLDQFIEFTAGPVIRAAEIRVEMEQRRQEADNFRTSVISERYGKRWRDVCWSRRLARKGKERRSRAARDVQEKLRQSQIRESRQASSVADLETFRQSARSSRSSSLDESVMVNENERRSKGKSREVVEKPSSTKSHTKPGSHDQPQSTRKHSVREGRRTQAAAIATPKAGVPQSTIERLVASQPVAPSPLRQSYRPSASISNTSASRYRSQARVDETKSTYFKMKARGLNPNISAFSTDKSHLTERKRSRSPETDESVVTGKRQQLSSPPAPVTSVAQSFVSTDVTATALGIANDEDEAIFASIRAAREAMQDSISFFHGEADKDELTGPQSLRSPAPANNKTDTPTSRFSYSTTAAAARAKLEDLNRSFASSTTSSLLSSQQPRPHELPLKYRNRVSKFVPRNLYADVLMQKRKELGGAESSSSRRQAYKSPASSAAGSFRQTIHRVNDARRGVVHSQQNGHVPQVEQPTFEQAGQHQEHGRGISDGDIEFEEDTDVEQDPQHPAIKFTPVQQDSRPAPSSAFTAGRLPETEENGVETVPSVGLGDRDTSIEFEKDDDPNADGDLHGYANGDALEEDEFGYRYPDEDEEAGGYDDELQEENEEGEESDEDDFTEDESDADEDQNGTIPGWDGKAGTSAEDAIEL